MPAKNPVCIHPENHQTEELPSALQNLRWWQKIFLTRGWGLLLSFHSLPIHSEPSRVNSFIATAGHRSPGCTLEGKVSLGPLPISLFSLPLLSCVCSCCDVLPHPQAPKQWWWPALSPWWLSHVATSSRRKQAENLQKHHQCLGSFVAIKYIRLSKKREKYISHHSGSWKVEVAVAERLTLRNRRGEGTGSGELLVT